MPKLTTIHLYGKLKRLFGSEIKLQVHTTIEAIKALCCTVDGFKNEFQKWDYRVIKGRFALDEGTLSMNVGNDDIHIMPVLHVAGGKGLGKIIGGIIIIGLAFTGVGAGIAATLGMSTAHMALIGGIMALGGIAQMHAKTPHFSTMHNEPVDSRPSFIFNGAENVTRQGNVVPIVYGKMIVGSVVVGSGMTTEQL